MAGAEPVWCVDQQGFGSWASFDVHDVHAGVWTIGATGHRERDITHLGQVGSGNDRAPIE